MPIRSPRAACIEPGGLGGRGDGRGDPGVRRLPRPDRLGAAAVKLGGDLVVQFSAEELGQHGPPRVVVAAQEARELTLRQQHDLGELRPVQPHDLVDQVADLGLVGRQARPAAVPSRRSRCTRIASVVNPCPRRFGRRCSGTRVMR